ncbi:RICIN domain-containing protein [Streptomyces nanshensis]|uniref:RICIN domain-containing protein n=1 Tax=Streptomyces nanshensis TaxID=518642 RepID=UPI00085BB0D7|nr:RICIN domain-containing protein [Streptomyces nanshensis]
MTGSRDENEALGGFPDEESAASARDAEESAGSSRSDDGGDGPPEGISPVVTTVNPRIVPAGSRGSTSPEPSSAPSSGRVRKAVLAGVAALALVGMSTGAYAMFGGDGTDRTPGAGGTPDPEWRGGQQNDAPGTAPAPSDTPSSDKDKDKKKDKKKDKDKDKGKGKPNGGSSPGDGDGGKDRPPEDDDDDAPSGPQHPPGGGGGGGGGNDGTVRIWNHNSDQCVNVPGGEGRDGKPLEIRTCSDADSMRWTFADDGTVRAYGLCMDVANGSTENGAVIQLAYCSGNPAQQFRLSEGSDLVNPQADKCVAVRDGDVQSGTPLQLWECSGDDSQKWSPI